ncbi:MAG: D-tyrosyl-tRNA(Tyr) deacylase [Clostridia bacterium]|nr:D-tyrosyl-tRNA(Tyr) deacylase [Clostridia bacterium]
MTAVIQRITDSSVIADGIAAGKARNGLFILLGVRSGDTEETALRMADKITAMRIFEDENGRMNFSVKDVGGEVLVVSNFTLCASCKRGNRPDFFGAEKPERANLLYELFSSRMRQNGLHTENGVFGADMKISLSLDGPVTIVLDSEIFS